MHSTQTQEEIKKIYEQYGTLIFRRCKTILCSEDEAWDATQDTFIKLMKNITFIQKKQSLYSWLLSTSTNHCISMLRKKRGVEFNEAMHSPTSNTQIQRMALQEIVKRLMAPWNKKVREVIIYTYFDGYKQKEIAELTGLGESTIRKYLTQFRRESQQFNTLIKEVLYE